MAKNVVFLVHGIGRHGEGWSAEPDGPIATLERVARDYDAFTDQDPLRNSIEFVEIRYDDIFDGILARWNELASGLANIPEATPDAIKEVRDAIQAYTDPTTSWFASHAVDVVFYTGFKLVRRLVQLRVALQIMQTVAEYGTLDRRYGVIAHSMGTAVAHDAIHRLTTTTWLSRDNQAALEAASSIAGAPLDAAALSELSDRYRANPFGPGKLNFDAIFMVANTSRLLSRDTPAPYKSNVRPRFAEPEPTKYICSRYVNVQHLLDPVGQIQRFRCEEIWPAAATRGNAHDLSGLKHVYDINVHGLSHYLIHPLVHAEIFAAFAPHRFTWRHYQRASERLADGGDFPQWGEKYRDEDEADAILAALSQIPIDLEPRSDVSGLVALYIALDRIYAELRQRFDN